MIDKEIIDPKRNSAVRPITLWLQDGHVGIGSFTVDAGLAAPRTCSGNVSLPIVIR
jgi:hypothetical protein